jgi:uncharacterized protein YyaL (SSP411 family)
LRFLLASLLLSLVATAAHGANAHAGETSAFLRSYADGPVNWMPWGEAAFARAKSEQKPVLLVIGTFTSELSRAMNKQTFSNAETAAFLNDTFVCVLVDAKEHREVVTLYQQYLQAVKQLNGLPMNLWLTPELKPFDGANYLPPTEEWGKEGFSTVAKRAAAGWKSDAAAQRAKAEEAVATVTGAQLNTLPEPVDDAALAKIVTEAKEAWRARFDADHGGFGDPPKYAEPELLRTLLLDPATRDMALTTLKSFVAGAVHDPLDGGFFRYASDVEWRHPYFQKTLADQARLALALIDAAKITHDASYANAASSALHYALIVLRNADGEFASAEDATPEPIMTGYFWTYAEIQKELGDDGAKMFSTAYAVTPEGNIPADSFPGITTTGKNILYRVTPPGSSAEEKQLADAARKLWTARQKRPHPLRDDAATSGTHGLLLNALTRVAVHTHDAAFTTAADDEYKFIKQKLLLADGSLRRLSGRDLPAAAEDYVLLTEGLQAYGSAFEKPSALATAKSLTTEVQARFWSPTAGKLLGSTANEIPAIWARLVLPPSAPADLPSADATLFHVLAAGSDKSASDLIDPLRRTLAADVRDAAETARGDLLLALASAKPAR